MQDSGFRGVGGLLQEPSRPTRLKLREALSNIQAYISRNFI